MAAKFACLKTAVVFDVTSHGTTENVPNSRKEVSKFPPDYTASHTAPQSRPSPPQSHRSRTTLIFTWRVEEYLHAFLLSASGRKLSASCPSSVIPRGKTSGTNKQQGWASPGASLGSVHTRAGHEGPDSVPSVQTAPVVRRIGDEVGLRSGMDDMKTYKIPCRESSRVSSVVRPVK